MSVLLHQKHRYITLLVYFDVRVQQEMDFSMRGRVIMDYIYIYSFSRRFYPKRLSIEENNKRYIIKMQTDIGSACNTNFLGIVQSKF